MSSKNLTALSRSETEILRLLWQLGSGTVAEIHDTLPEGRRIAYATVQTLLRRLERKGYVSHQTKGKAHVFHPAARREDVVTRTVGDFVEGLFGGDPVPLMLHLAENTTLDPEDVERLKSLIAKAESQQQTHRG